MKKPITKTKLVIEAKPYITEEDNGASLIAEVEDDESDIFVRIMSYDTHKRHNDLRQFIGYGTVSDTKIKITLEVIRE